VLYEASQLSLLTVSYVQLQRARIIPTMSDSEDDSPHGPDITWPLDRPENQQNGGAPLAQPALPSFDSSFMVGGSKSLSAISSRAFFLGVTFGVMAIMAIELAYLQISIWRATCFIGTLSIFHYLEFYATARYNPSDAKLSSFLLSSNGSAYNIAHTSALIEFAVRKWLQSSQRPSWLWESFRLPPFLPTLPPISFLLLGFFLVAVGQGVRTAAMAEAGKSFNHIVQSRKKDDHVLVQSGIYRILRHPSYFGFFWWGLGTQIFLGNHVCFLAYALILWRFFATRIAKEEKFLVKFFGQDYVRYRERTPVLIPFIR
jgi:protein-S-isoprenylcysteine O-methyltransferase